MGLSIEKSDFKEVGGGGKKNQYIRGELPKKWGAWTVSRFKREVCKKERVMYVRGNEELCGVS